MDEKPIHLPPKLVMVVDNKGRKLIIVPLKEQLPLTRQAHTTLLHQKGARVFHDLSQKYFWKNVEKDIICICKTCKECLANQVRRKRLTAEFTQANEKFADMMKNKIYKTVDDFKKGFKYVTHDKAPEVETKES